MKQFLTTKGRLTRSAFGGVNLLTLIAFVIAGGIQEYFGRSLPPWLTTGLALIVILLLVIGVIVQIKRWHDLNKSWIWILINFIPVFGGLWAIIQCGFVRGTEGENQYGLDPLEETPA
jgi:uncharacterized membrane protein YhaH (DUF805 family)